MLDGILILFRFEFSDTKIDEELWTVRGGLNDPASRSGSLLVSRLSRAGWLRASRDRSISWPYTVGSTRHPARIMRYTSKLPPVGN